MNGDSFISEYQHLPYLPYDGDALMLLRKVALSVMPIMDMHNWRVGLLCEMYPSDPTLLGLNYYHGQRVCLRLRLPHDSAEFMSMEEVADTMLHELCHIVEGDHNQYFYALWNQLRQEYGQLIRSGYTGEPILSYGPQYGGGAMPMEEARRVAREAAVSQPGYYGGASGGVRGTPMPAGLNPQVFFADAHQNGGTVMRGCLCGRPIPDDVLGTGYRTMAEPSDLNQQMIMRAFAEMIQYPDGVFPHRNQGANAAGFSAPFPHSGNFKHGGSGITPGPSPYGRTNPGGSSFSSGPSPHGRANPGGSFPPSRSSTPRIAGLPDNNSAPTWNCQLCSRANPHIFSSCENCGTPRPGGTFY